MTVIIFHRTRESTEYTVLHTSVYMGKNQKLLFFIPDANLTSIKFWLTRPAGDWEKKLRETPVGLGNALFKTYIAYL